MCDNELNFFVSAVKVFKGAAFQIWNTEVFKCASVCLTSYNQRTNVKSVSQNFVHSSDPRELAFQTTPNQHTKLGYTRDVGKGLKETAA